MSKFITRTIKLQSVTAWAVEIEDGHPVYGNPFTFKLEGSLKGEKLRETIVRLMATDKIYYECNGEFEVKMKMDVNTFIQNAIECK